MSVARSLILSLSGFIQWKWKRKKTKPEEYYRMAADIAIQNDNDAVAERVFKDMAEFKLESR